MRKLALFICFIALLAITLTTTPSAHLSAGKRLSLTQAADLSTEVMARHVRALAIDERDVKMYENVIDDLAMAHSRWQQTFQGVPVFGGQAIVHLNSEGGLFAVTDNLVRAIQVDTRPELSERDAAARAVRAFGCNQCLTDEPATDLWVLRHEDRDHLVYRVELRREDGSEQTSLPVYFIDAHSGAVVWHYDNLQTAKGHSLYSGVVDITSSGNKKKFYLTDLTRKIGTFDLRGKQGLHFHFKDSDDLWDAPKQLAAIDAHFGTAATFDYYLTQHDRLGIDGKNGPGGYTATDDVTLLISSRVHYGNNFSNAFWNGRMATYGDGDNLRFSPLVALDVVGHELTHGVVQFSAGLIYSGESGALNESMADIFGAMIERSVKGESADTWRLGEQCFTPNTDGDALRYLDNPHAAGNRGATTDDDPDHYSERYIGQADGGGVHINSGISNKAFYLVAKGGTHHLGGSMSGIGADAAARIWYKALTSFMTARTDFKGARSATLNAAAAIYGENSREQTAVATAWSMVGVE